MGQADMIVAIIAMLGSLFLVTQGGRFRGISMDRRIKLALVWGVIFLAVILLVRVLGLHDPRP